VRSAHLELRVAPPLFSSARVGFIVPKHRENSVARNRLKRRLRELVRRLLLPRLAPVDVVIRTLPTAYSQEWAALVADFQTLTKRLPLVEGRVGEPRA
jgi:ribonuclease P protein component